LEGRIVIAWLKVDVGKSQLSGGVWGRRSVDSGGGGVRQAILLAHPSMDEVTDGHDDCPSR